MDKPNRIAALSDRQDAHDEWDPAARRDRSVRLSLALGAPAERGGHERRWMIATPPWSAAWLGLRSILWAALLPGLFIGYEEPTLRRLFGASYERYTREVRRWLPRRGGYTVNRS